MRAPTGIVAKSFSATACAGLLLVVLAAFLPWVRSGSVERNSFDVAGVIGRLLPWDNALLDVALSAWLAVPVLCLVGVLLFVLGLRRSAAVLTVLVCAIAGTIAVAAYVVGQDGPTVAQTVAAGPLSTTAGGVIGLIGAVGTLLAVRTTVPEQA